MAFDIGNGISALGASIASQAGAEALNEQKAQLEIQKEQLASQLAEGRETRLAGVRFGYDSQIEGQRNDAAMARTNVTEAGANTRETSREKNALIETSMRTQGEIQAALARHKIDGNDVTDIQTDDATGKKYAITKKGQMIDLGITGPNSADEKLMNRAENFAKVKKTTVDADTGNKDTEEVVDPAKAADYLRRQGRDDLANAYAKAPPATPPVIPKGLPVGSQFNAYRKQWRDPDGKLYDMNGNPVGDDNSQAKPTGPAPRLGGGLINMPTPGL